MQRVIYVFAGLGFFLLINSCVSEQAKETNIKQHKLSEAFKNLWYDGNAEIATYKLSQNRYGSLHNGFATLIFVTEDFSKTKQVKLDNPATAGNDKVSVLKLNFIKNFITGIYPYSVESSVFTPVDLSGTLKLSTSVQEWCGHTFTQLNRISNGFKLSEYSYFEDEGDQTKVLPNVLLEDELWNTIRIAPEKLPLGNIVLMRSNIAVRLQHKPVATIKGTATLSNTNFNNQEAKEYLVQFEDRSLRIYYEQNFPFTILGWQETDGSASKPGLVTNATLIKTKRLPYWQLKNPANKSLRDSLGLFNY
jgi:hypothetical protein